jgi:hypothetical protein
LPAGCVALLCVALAREDETVPERAAAAEQLVTVRHLPAWQALVAASLRDDAAPLQAAVQSIIILADMYPSSAVTNNTSVGFWIMTLTTMFLSERGLLLPARLLDLLAAPTHPEARCHAALHHSIAIAVALAAGDDMRLAVAIDDAEAHELIPHAARMRIVLARRIGDLAQLERARPVLEGLGDRQALRRLREVAADLSPQPLP